MFERGDKVRVLPGQSKSNAREGEIYTVTELEKNRDGEVLLVLEGIDGAFFDWRFEMADCEDEPLVIGPDPNKPYPNPARDEEQQQRMELINYKKALRDLLYGTTSSEGK